MKRERRGLVMGLAFPFLLFAMETGEAFTFQIETPWLGGAFRIFAFAFNTFTL